MASWCSVEILAEVGVDDGWRYAARAWAEDAEAALLAARTLWDEAYTGVQGCKRRITFTVEDDVVLRTVTRP